MIVDAADFSNGEFEEDIDGAAASCREHKVLIVMIVCLLKHQQQLLTGGRDLPPVGGREAEDLGHHEPGLHAAAEVVTHVSRQPGHRQVIH